MSSLRCFGLRRRKLRPGSWRTTAKCDWYENNSFAATASVLARCEQRAVSSLEKDKSHEKIKSVARRRRSGHGPGRGCRAGCPGAALRREMQVTKGQLPPRGTEVRVRFLQQAFSAGWSGVGTKVPCWTGVCWAVLSDSWRWLEYCFLAHHPLPSCDRVLPLSKEPWNVNVHLPYL